MDRNEAVLKLARGTLISMAHAEDLYDSFFEKPVVPQYVADWYEENKDGLEFNLIDWINKLPLGIDGVEITEFDEWLLDDEQALTTIVNMHQFGYEVEVEKEPKYTVRIKGIGGYSKYLNRDTKTQKWLFASKTELERFRAHHTRKELEDADFGWVFSCPGMEIKEVE